LCNIYKFKCNLVFSGILSVLTKKNLVNSIRFNRPFKKFKVDQSLENVFYNGPDYYKPGNPKSFPDFRILLYWKPDIQLKPDEDYYIEFYASDYLTEYLVELKGFSIDGQPIKGYTRFKIYR
jgi:hypothetical protein